MPKKPPLSSLTPVEYAARLKRILFSALGRAWCFWPPRNEVKKRCKVEGKTGWFKCEICLQERERIDVDHIQPVVPVSGFTTWDHYIASRFVTADKLQGICKDCHKKKTKEENTERRALKKEKDNGR